MTLTEYLTAGHKTRKSVEIDGGIPVYQLCNVLNGNRAVSLRLAGLIEKGTDGLVPAEAWPLPKDDLIVLAQFRGK